MTTEAYIPKPGDQVRVRRYQVPCPELTGIAERKLAIEVAGTVATVRGADGLDDVLLTLEGCSGPIFTGRQFGGQDPEHGCSWTLVTEVVPLAGVAAHDQAGLDARVAACEREKAGALLRWERARDDEVTARQRLTGAQERLEAAMRAAARHRVAKPAFDDLDSLSERRRTDRTVMVQHVASLARSHGLCAVTTADESRRLQYVDLEGPHGLRLTVRFQGNTPQEAADTYVLSWYGVQDGYRLKSGVFGAGVDPYYGHKATDTVHGFRVLVQVLARRFAAIADGSAFVPAS